MAAALSGQLLGLALKVSAGRARWTGLDRVVPIALGVAVLLGRFAWGWIGRALLAAYLALLGWWAMWAPAAGREALFAWVTGCRRRPWLAAALFPVFVLMLRLVAASTSLPPPFAPVLLAF